jgi:hypothetical protein
MSCRHDLPHRASAHVLPMNRAGILPSCLATRISTSCPLPKADYLNRHGCENLTDGASIELGVLNSLGNAPRGGALGIRVEVFLSVSHGEAAAR